MAFVFSIDNPESFRNIENKWKEEVCKSRPDVPVILIACKADLRDKQHPIEGALVETQAVRTLKR